MFFYFEIWPYFHILLIPSLFFNSYIFAHSFTVHPVFCLNISFCNWHTVLTFFKVSFYINYLYYMIQSPIICLESIILGGSQIYKVIFYISNLLKLTGIILSTSFFCFYFLVDTFWDFGNNLLLCIHELFNKNSLIQIFTDVLFYGPVILPNAGDTAVNKV